MKNLTKNIAMVADDTEFFCLSMKEEFEQNGFKVITAKNGLELRSELQKCLDHLNQNPDAYKVKIVVADIQMPLEDGDQVLRDRIGPLKFHGFHCFVLSANSPENLPPEIKYLSKSSTPQEIVQKAITSST